MAIEVKNTDVIFRLVKEKLEKAKAKLGPAVADEVARMIRRTKDGKDVDGQPFAKYTPAYNRFKGKLRSGFITRTGKRGKKAGQVKGEYSVTQQPVDLILSGNMLNAIETNETTSETSATVTVFFNSALEGAKAHGNMRKRRFFGFSDEQVARIKKKLEE